MAYRVSFSRLPECVGKYVKMAYDHEFVAEIVSVDLPRSSLRIKIMTGSRKGNLRRVRVYRTGTLIVYERCDMIKAVMSV